MSCCTFVPPRMFPSYCCEIEQSISTLWNLKLRVFFVKKFNVNSSLKESFQMKMNKIKPINSLTGGSPSSFCHIAVLGGLESTSHLSDTGIPSRNGYPKPGVLVIANDGVSV